MRLSLMSACCCFVLAGCGTRAMRVARCEPVGEVKAAVPATASLDQAAVPVVAASDGTQPDGRKAPRASTWEDVYFDPDDRRSSRTERFRRRPMGSPWRTRPRFFGELTLAGGPFEHDTETSNLGDSTGAVLLRGKIEGLLSRHMGVGVQHEFTASDDDLFQGLAVASLSPARAEIHDSFVYLLIAPPSTREFRTQLRLGPYVQRLRLGEESSTADATWESIGLRANFEPEFILHRDDRMELSVFASGSAGFHDTRIDFDTSAVSQKFDTDGATLGLDAGLRLRYGTFSLGVFYLYREIYNDQSEPENGAVIREVGDTFQGVAIGIGARF